MSHFTVLVTADNDKDLERKLLPYHEYECTGIEEYLEFVEADMEELQKDYAEHARGQTLEQFAEQWGGYTTHEGKIGRWTNPNAKWDWWVIGGRWQGLLLTKQGARVNMAPAGKVDWQGLRDEETRKASTRWQRWRNLPKKEEVGEEAWRKALWENGFIMVTIDEAEDLDALSQEEYTEKYGKREGLTYALLHEGQWLARGTMGWWGVTSDPQEDYHAAWWRIVESLPAEQRVYVVDCHI